MKFPFCIKKRRENYEYKCHFLSIYNLMFQNSSDDLRRTAGRSWMRVVEDRARWREIGEAYVQHWNVVG
jgi:hypothetical protein